MEHRLKKAIIILVSVIATVALFALTGCAPGPAASPGAAAQPTASGSQPASSGSKSAASSSQPAAPSTASPVTIGLVTEVTGAQASTGDNQTNGIKMAMDEINQKGGIKGQQVKLVIEDDASTPAGTVTAFNKLMSGQKPTAVFISNFANFDMAIEPAIKTAAIPAITGASGPDVTAAGNPWIFRVRTNDNIMGRLAAEYAVKDMGAKKPAILYVTGDMGAGASKIVAENLKSLGVPPVDVESYNPNDKDVTAQLLNMQKAGADLVIGWGYPPDAAMVMTSMKQLGVKMKLLGSPAYAVSDALKLAGSAADGVTTITDWVASDDPAVQAWAKKMEARAHLPANFIHSVYYDGMNILAQTIEKVGTDPTAIRDGLRAVKDYKGITGVYSFDKNGDGLRQAYIAQIKDGKPVMIKSIKADQ